MSILALELSSPLGSIAFRSSDGTSIVRQFPADRKDSGFFFQNLNELRRECGLPEVIAVGLGPGSYAGIRIAIATALGLRAAAGARLNGWPSICAIDCAEYLVVGDARRNSYFFAHVRGGDCLAGPVLMSEKELRVKLDEQKNLPRLSTQPLPQFAEVSLAYPSATILAALAESRGTEEPLEPIYLREPYITTSKETPWNR